MCRYMQRYVDQVIVPNRYMEEFYGRRCGYPRSLVSCLPNAVSMDRFHPGPPDAALRGALAIPADTFVIGTVGGQTKVKGHQYLLRAFARLARELSDSWLVLVGEGRETQRLKALAEQLGIAERTTFVRWQDKVCPYLNLFDVFVLPSVLEADGIALKEAMACALPVVATHVGGPSVILEEGQTGLLVPPRNPQALADRIRWVADNPAEATAMGRRAREECLRSYSMSSFAQRLWEINEPWL